MTSFLACLCGACGRAPDEPEPAACRDGSESVQRYGTDCLCCHAEFGVAGSVDHEGPRIARITVLGAEGGKAEMAPNEFDNFFRHIQLTPPLEVTVLGVDGLTSTMPMPADSGSCNRCHGDWLPLVHAP